MSRFKVSPPDPVVISWSGLKRWENCPQHQLRTITKETEKSNKGRIFLPGTVADIVVRNFLLLDDPQKGNMEDMVASIFDEVVEKGESKIIWKGSPLKDMEDVKTTVREAVNKVEPWLFKEVLPYDYQPDVRFNAYFDLPYVCADGVRGPVKMIGAMDIAVRYPDGKFGIFDLKITKSSEYMRSTLGQLTFYDLAWAAIQGDFEASSKWGFIAPLTPEYYFPVTVTSDDRKVMLSRIMKYAQGSWRDEWDPKSDDANCGWCEARTSCEKFKVVHAVDENGKQKASFAQAAAQRSQFRKVEAKDD